MVRGKRIATNNKKKTTKTKRCKRTTKYTGYVLKDDDDYGQPNNVDENNDYMLSDLLKGSNRNRRRQQKNTKELIKKAAKVALAVAGGLAAGGAGLYLYDKNKEHFNFATKEGKKFYNNYFDPMIKPVWDTVVKYTTKNNAVRRFKNYYEDGVNDKLDDIQSLISNKPYDVDPEALKKLIEKMETDVKDKDDFKINDFKKVTKDILDGASGYEELTKQLKEGQKTAKTGIENLNNMIWTARELYNSVMH